MGGMFDWLLPIVGGMVYDRVGGDGSGDTPNQYPVKLTPEQQWVFDQLKSTVEAGGSPTMKAVRSGAQSFLEGLPTGAPAGFSFMSPHLQGQSPLGGITLPKFDFSKYPGNTPPTSTPPTRPGDPGGPGVGGPGGREITDTFTGREDEWLGRGIGPGGGTPQISYDFDTPGPNGTTFSDAFKQMAEKHPNWTSLGVNVILGILAGLTGGATAFLAPLVRGKFMEWAGGGNTPLPGNFSGDFGPTGGEGLPKVGGGGFGDMMNRSPGVAGGFNPADSRVSAGGNTYHWVSDPTVQGGGYYAPDARVNYDTPQNLHTGGLTGVPGGSTFAGQTAGWGQKSGASSGRGAGARMGRWR